jgi:ABC-type multidrug transport system ATPase subunit/ABC-type transporter Mla maintaining outer membrane lipid asymmetry permease subunit MlaE
VLAFRGYSLGFPRRPSDLLILENVDLELASGRFCLLVGASGAGKSTLMKLLTGLWEAREPKPIQHGRLEVLGHDLVARPYPQRLRGKVQAVLQEEGLLDELTPIGNVKLALRAAGRPARLARDLLARVGLPEPPRSVARLSGGMRKRVAVARALAGEPRLLIFDEPTAGLDADGARALAEQLLEWQRAGERQSTIVITHDIRAFAGLADEVLRLDGERRTIERIPGEAIAHGTLARGFGTAPFPAPGSTARRRPWLRFGLGIGDWAATLGASVLRLAPRYPGLALRSALDFTFESASFTAVGSGVVGGLATFFALRNNPLEGAFSGAVLTGSGKVLVSVLVPLLAAFFFTARIAAGAAARLGTMKRTSQVAALRLLGVDPADFLLIPLVWGVVLALPIATFVGIIAACLSSALATAVVTGHDARGWAWAFFDEVGYADHRWNLLRATLSGFLVAVTTYHLAVGPKRSGRDVGDSVNRTIVLGIFLVLGVHSIATLLQFR